MDGNNNGTVLGKLSFIFGIIGMVCSISICCSGFRIPVWCSGIGTWYYRKE